MSGANMGVGNQGGNHSNPTNGTSTGMVTIPPFLPFMVGMSLPDFS